MIQDEWRVMNSGDPENVTSLIVDAKGYRIARAYPSRNGQETARARARLIATAPEMAAFLLKLARMPREYFETGDVLVDLQPLLARIEEER